MLEKNHINNLITNNEHMRYLLASLLFLAFNVSLFAQEFTAVNSNGVTINYNICDENCVEVAKYAKFSNLNWESLYTGHVSIPSKVTYEGKEYEVRYIGSYAFQNSTQLTSVVMPGTIKGIKRMAFNGCTNLTEFYPPSSLEFVEEDAYSDCNIKKVWIVNLNHWLTINFSNESSNPLNCGGDIVDSFNTVLYDICIPTDITEINNYAFINAGSLQNIRMHDNITTIGKGAFSGCNFLWTLHMPEKLQVIDAYAFSGCKTLTRWEFPETLSEIGRFAFGNIDIKYIECRNPNPPSILHPYDAFNRNTETGCVLHIPEGSKDRYMQAEGWKNFLNIQDDISGLEDILFDSSFKNIYTVYDLLGHCLLYKGTKSQLADLVLARGIYIINDKKVLID